MQQNRSDKKATTMAAEAKKNQMLKERAIEIEYKISRLGVVGRAYYEASQIKLRRNRMMIRAARTQNMLLHSALQLLIQREMAAKKQTGNLDGMRKQAKSLRKEFDQERNKTIAMQLQLQKQITDTRSAEIVCADILDPNTPALEKIRILDSRLEAIIAKTRDTQVVERHFENLLTPMREEKLIYSSQLDSIGNIINIKSNEIMQLKMLKFDATKSRDQARKELEQLLASFQPKGKKQEITPELQARILAAVRKIKMVMDVDSMKVMYGQYMFQEKQTTYLTQVHADLKITISQLRNEAPHPQRRKTLPLAQVHTLASQTKEMVRRVSSHQKRKNSFPLLMIIEGTKKLVDRLHEGNTTLEDKPASKQKDIMADCEIRLVKLLKGLGRKIKYLKAMDEERVRKEKEERDMVIPEGDEAGTSASKTPPLASPSVSRSTKGVPKLDNTLNDPEGYSPGARKALETARARDKSKSPPKN